MSKNIFILPNALVDEISDRCNIMMYETTYSSKNNRVLLNQHLLCFIREGEKTIIDSLSAESFDKNNILLLNAGAKLMSENTLNSVYESILVFFSDKVVEDVLTKVKTIENEHLAKGRKIFSIEKDEIIRNFEKSLRLNMTILKRDERFLQVKIEEFLLYAAIISPNTIIPFLQNALSDNKNLKFKSFISTHIDNNLNLEELAFLAGMSLSTFKRKFKNVYKISPGQYFSNYRMSKAARLLNQEQSITETAFKLGYESLSSFSSAFKKHFGAPPKKFLGNK